MSDVSESDLTELFGLSEMTFIAFRRLIALGSLDVTWHLCARRSENGSLQSTNRPS